MRSWHTTCILRTARKGNLASSWVTAAAGSGLGALGSGQHTHFKSSLTHNSRGCCREMNVLQTSERRKGTDIREKSIRGHPTRSGRDSNASVFSISKHRGIRGSKFELTQLFSGALITQSPSRSFLKPHLAETTASPPCPCPCSQTHSEGNSPRVVSRRRDCKVNRPASLVSRTSVQLG